MLTFFRRIRKGLLGSGQARKYVLYAVGEIALVVIGILIALQINNWNEWRKDRETEKKVLEDLMDNLERNIITIQNTIFENEQRIQSANVILHGFDRNLPYNDSLDRHFFQGILIGQVMHGYPAKDGYESFKNVGFDMIQNDTLKKKIVYLFEEIYKRAEEWGNYCNSFAPEIGSLWSIYFKRTNLTALKPLDYDLLLSSTEVYNNYAGSRGFNNNYLWKLEESQRETQRVLQLIKEELQSAADAEERQ
jgi:hypothetical protein